MGRQKGPTKRKPTPREIVGVPGTVEPGFKEREIFEEPVSQELHDAFARFGVDSSKMRQFRMGPCVIMINEERPNEGAEPLLHLTISAASRYPTWDEIKVARYLLLPADKTFAMLLPPPDQYVNVPEQDRVFQLWEISDPRLIWEEQAEEVTG